MATTTTKKPARPAKPPAARARRGAAAPAKAPLERTSKLSREVLESIESGHRAALEAVRTFLDTVEETLPAHEHGASRRKQIVDSAMEMADTLIHTQYDFIRKVVGSAGKSLGSPDAAKAPRRTRPPATKK